MFILLNKFINGHGVCYMTVNKINMAVQITKTVLSALGFSGAAEGLEILHNLSNSLIFQSRDSKKAFIEKLQEGISAIINSENIGSNVQEMVNDTFDKCFQEDDLIEYYDEKDELVKKLLENWGDSKTIGKDYEAFEKLIRAIITSLYDNICEFTKTEKLISKLLDDTKEIKGKVAETNKNLKKLENDVNRLETKISSSDTIQPRNLTIVDDNEEYNIIYTKALFMENEVGDSKTATLKNVFIKPSLENDRITLEEKLKTWRNSSNINADEYTYANSSVFLLYGKAGVGKSSFTSYIISENILGDKCHAVALRKYADKLNHKRAWESVKEIYECSDEKLYKGTVLILDGLDEVCVLQQGFDGKAFIEDLTDNIPNGVKILITSRNYEGYFNEVKASYDLTIATITWTNVQVEEWCKSYVKVHECKENWSTEFLSKYNKLKDYDKRKEIFCIPIILYICCVSEIDIEEHNSVAGIYDTAFKNIGGREHSRRNRSSELTESDKRQFDINWQYTKELAFQMFLNNTLESALGNDLVNAAKAMTAKICNTTEADIQPETDRYYAVFHFVSQKSEGIEFAHKTVGEYFTAVKLYEDYFANTLTDMSDESVEDIWKNIFQAFRYKKIPEDIMQYFAELVKARKTKDKCAEETKSYSEWRGCFIDSYYKGMQEQLLWKMMTQNTNYNLKENFLLPEQVAIAFRNLTWLLAAIDFDNSNITAEKKIYVHIIESFFIRSFNMDVNLYLWQHLSGIDLSGAYLRGAYLRGAYLRGTNLNYANLNSAHLRAADLNYADLNGAHLIGADLNGAHLNGADLNGAHLIGADLNGADLNGADLNGAGLNGAGLNGAYLSGAYLSGANLIGVHLFKSDLPKFDDFIKNDNVKLINPIIDDVDMTKYFYDPETNRMKPIKKSEF